jgi:hypothetical protein
MIAPGAMSSASMAGDECPPCDAIECEELPDGLCLVTCYYQGEVVRQFVCDPVECDLKDCEPMESCEPACSSGVSTSCGS